MTEVWLAAMIITSSLVLFTEEPTGRTCFNSKLCLWIQCVGVLFVLRVSVGQKINNVVLTLF